MKKHPATRNKQRATSILHPATSSLLFLLICFAFSCASKEAKQPLFNGYPLPTMSLENIEGEKVDLSEISKDKIVLVEFWASWCKPCRDKHPELNRIYKTYKDQKFQNADGFEIYYVNLDKKKKDWQAAMEKDKIDHWTYHVADLRGMKKSDLPTIYDFEQIPTAFVIDTKGTIIGKDLSEDRLFHLLKRRLATVQ